MPPDPDPVRAWRIERGLPVPVPVFALADGSVAIWVAGLAPGREATVAVRGLPGGERFTVRAGDRGTPIPEELPEVLRPLYPSPGEAAREWLALVRNRADSGIAILTESELMNDLPVLRKVAPEVWPQVLAWLEEERVVVNNVVRALRFASADPPPAVSWHLLHRYADPGSSLARLEATSYPLELPVLLARRPPLLALARVEEWCREPELARGPLLRQAARMSRALADEPGWKPFLCLVPTWLPAAGAADPYIPEPGSLAARLAEGARARKARKAPPDLVAAANQPGEAGLAACMGLGMTGDPAVIPALMERYRTAPEDQLPWLDAALEVLRTPPGYFTHAEGPTLLRVGFDEFPIERVEVRPGVVAVFRNEIQVIYYLIPDSELGFEVVGKAGERVRFQGTLMTGHTRYDREVGRR